MSRLDAFDQKQQHPRPALPQHSGLSELWRDEHTSAAYGFNRGRITEAEKPPVNSGSENVA
jgi:hypothetical protein